MAPEERLENMSAFTLDRDTVLRKAVELGGSDLIITADHPVMMTIAGVLQPMPGSPLVTSADSRRLAESFLTPALHEKFLRDQELDTRYHFPGVANFRVNLYIQRGHWGAAVRIVPLAIPLPSESLPSPMPTSENTLPSPSTNWNRRTT